MTLEEHLEKAAKFTVPLQGGTVMPVDTEVMYLAEDGAGFFTVYANAPSPNPIGNEELFVKKPELPTMPGSVIIDVTIDGYFYPAMLRASYGTTWITESPLSATAAVFNAGELERRATSLTVLYDRGAES